MHPRNPHKDRYDLKHLSIELPELSQFVFTNQHGIESLDFSNPHAVRALNKAILKCHYGIKFWEIPSSFLCPPIPGRAEYIHQIADLFENHKGLRVLDIGVGANCIYPIIGTHAYNWSFVGSDTNQIAIQSAQRIIENNELQGKIQLRHQNSNNHFFRNIILKEEIFDLTICNPPFHETQDEGHKGTSRKWKNLGKNDLGLKLNFGGQGAELWYPGGEVNFISGMINESFAFNNQVSWFSSLVAKKESLEKILRKIKQLPLDIKILEMELGNKKSRILVWRKKI
jgi:23S rRNA (adenine1618-N6)-methyltransferase